ncbi:MAG: hypothetical protein WCQ95_10815 [Bacteroidota bacterium]
MPTSIPTSKLGRNSYFMTVVAYLVTNKVRLGVSAARLLALQNLYGEVATPGTYLALWLLYANKASSRTVDVIADLNEIESRIIALLLEIYNDIPDSVWTNADRNAMKRKAGLPHLHTKPEAPLTAQCILTINGFPNGLFNITARDAEDSKRSSLPEGADALEIRYAYIESPVRKPTTPDLAGKVRVACMGPDDNTTSVFIFKARGELQTDANLAGFQIVIFGRWINTKYPKLAGKWSVRYTLMITLA